MPDEEQTLAFCRHLPGAPSPLLIAIPAAQSLTRHPREAFSRTRSFPPRHPGIPDRLPVYFV